MIVEDQEQRNQTNLFNTTAGLFIGALIKAFAMLLLAPQAGVKTRSLLQKKGTRILDRTSAFAGSWLMNEYARANKRVFSGQHKTKRSKKTARTGN